MSFKQLVWRTIAGASYRTAKSCNRISEWAYPRCLPRISSAERRLTQTNSELHNRHAGSRCFVIGNGRSLRKQDLSLLANDITFAVNAFWKHPVVKIWQPTYYLFSDPILFDGSDPVQRYFQSLRSQINKTNFIVPILCRSAIEEQKLIPLDSTYFVASEGVFSDLPSDMIDLTKAVPHCETIAQLAIISAMYMGCSPIYLIGLDHDYLARRDGDLNFYEGKSLDNHPLVTGTLMCPYDVDMEGMLMMWKLYRKLDEHAKRLQIQILNATDGGFLDVFERVSYDSLFDNSESKALEGY